MNRSKTMLDQLLVVHARAHGTSSIEQSEVPASLESWQDHRALVKLYSFLNKHIRTHVSIAGHMRSTYHLIGYTGFFLSLLVSCLLAGINQLSIPLCVALSVSCALISRGLAYASARWLGRPNIVFLRYFWIVVLLTSGLLWYGGFPVVPYVEILILGIGIMLAFGRLGCLMAGCCHGRPATNGIRYGDSHVRDGLPPSLASCPLVPIQFIEHVWVLGILGLSFLGYFADPGSGSAMVFFILSYSLGRFLFEFYRGDPERALRGRLSEPQWTSLLNIIVFAGFGLAGWLPFQLPHLLVTLTLLLILIYVGWTGKWLGTPLYLTPAQYIEMAKGLETLQKSAGMVRIDPDTLPQSIHIKNISPSILISALQFPFDKPGHLHYTISSSHITLNLKEAVSIARLIVAFDSKKPVNFAIKRYEKGVFQLVALT